MGLSITGKQQDTLRDALVKEMKTKAVTPTMITTAKNISLVNLSRMLGGSRTFTLEVLDAITETLDLPAGHFYSYYIKECWAKEGNRLRKKTEEYVVRCLELGLMNLVKQTMNELTAIPGNLQTVFSIGENLFGLGRQEEALAFYDKVIEKETNKLSTDLAVSYYRRFLIVREIDMIHAYEAAIRLTDYIDNLKGLLQTEAYLRILAVFFAIEHWAGLEKYSRKLANISVDHDPEAYAGALFYQGVVAEVRGEYPEALQLIDKYANGVNEHYSSLAFVNKLTVEITAGNQEKVKEMMGYIKENPERSRNLSTVIKALVVHGTDDEVNRFLEEFEPEIKRLHAFTDPLSAKYITTFRFYRALYYINSGRSEAGIDDLLYAVEIGAKLKMPTVIIRCVNELLKNIGKGNEKQIASFVSALEEYEKIKSYDTICII